MDPFLKRMGIDFEYGNEPINRFEKKDLNNLKELENFFLNLNHNLKKTSTNTVFSNHQYDAGIMIIGEAPGAEEDVQGMPFVGKSGQLLTLMLEAINLKRTDVYITNLVPWRPPGNRNPDSEEMAFFLPYLKKHILLKKPKCIILLGSIVTKALFGNNTYITQIRGKWQNLKIEDKEFPLLCSFHPSYLLRSPKQKKLAWFDLLKIQKFLRSL